jgi:outer membrane protein TolC
MEGNTMNRLFATGLVFALLSLFVALHCSAELRELDNATKGKVRELQQKRVEVLREALQLVIAMYREGALDFRRVHSVQRDLLEAQLDMAKTREAQIEVLTSQLKIAKGSLAITEEMFKAGATTALDVHLARSAMLSIEIRLLKLRVMDKSKQPE